MGLFDGCILACDIDGTLLINGYINPRNVEKIDFFMSEGGFFSLATGRTVGAVSTVLRALKSVSPSVVANGCMIYDFERQKILSEKCIDKADYRIAETVFNYLPEVGIEIHSGSDVLVLRQTAETDDHQRYEELSSQVVSFEEACRYNWNKVLYLFSEEKSRLKTKEIISACKTHSDFVDTSATLYGRKRNYYEQTPVGINKASGLLELCKIQKIKKGGFFAIGDYYNDLEMIKKADISAVPSESPDDIKAYADFIAGTCRDGAVADFIDYLTKIRKG